MKIKSFFLIAAGALILFSTPSCTNLDETVYDQVTAEKFGRNEAEVQAIVAPIYNSLKRYFSNNWLYLSESSGDMSITPTRKGGDWFDGGVHRDLHMHTWTADSDPIKRGWEKASQSISLCNLIHETISSSKVISDENKKRFLAEIRGIRAFWLYVMMDSWGNVPLAVDFKDTNLPPTKSRKEVYDFIIKELEEIKGDLISDVSLATYGLFTKGSAYTLLAKMYLNAEAWGVATNQWQKAAEACDVVMGLGYILEPNWKTNFQTQNEVSKEAILAVCYSSGDTEDNNNLHCRTLHYLDNIVLGGSWGAWNGICAQEEYAKLFDEKDHRLQGTFLIGEMKDPVSGKVMETAHNRPLIHTITLTKIEAGPGWGEVNQEDGYRCIKWDFDKGTISALENDFHIFRLADVYLMKAEALVRMGGDNGEATKLVNTIRERGFGDASHNYTAVTLEEIALERKLELAWECHARQDCIRFGTFQDARFVKPDTKGKDHLKIFPIPQTALDANNQLKQNPGY